MKSTSNKRHEKGQGLVEYALILVLVAIVVIGALTVFGPTISNTYSEISAALGGSCQYSYDNMRETQEAWLVAYGKGASGNSPEGMAYSKAAGSWLDSVHSGSCSWESVELH